MRRVTRSGALLVGLVSMLLGTNCAYCDDHKIRRVLVISIDGMHALDMALWVRRHPGSALGCYPPRESITRMPVRPSRRTRFHPQSVSYRWISRHWRDVL